MYTISEKTEKKYTIAQAIEVARILCNGQPVCSNAISGRALNEKITLVELNLLSEEMVSDTYFYNN